MELHWRASPERRHRPLGLDRNPTSLAMRHAHVVEGVRALARVGARARDCPNTLTCDLSAFCRPNGVDGWGLSIHAPDKLMTDR